QAGAAAFGEGDAGRGLTRRWSGPAARGRLSFARRLCGRPLNGLTLCGSCAVLAGCELHRPEPVIDYAGPRDQEERPLYWSLPLALLAAALSLPLTVHNLVDMIEPVIVWMWLAVTVGCYGGAVSSGLAALVAARRAPSARAGLFIALALLPAVLVRNTLFAGWFVFRGFP
ncbi:MAG TPA: hypothetical protein VGR35_01310, partial [Tepidisphaeraceae bacterium]|nr:hypothetical protein [Tepidisphaeraceae bacterium]